MQARSNRTAYPLLFDEDLEAAEGPVIGIEKQLREARQLRRAIPAVAAMHEHVALFPFD
jgi:hypothetical protein